MRLSPTAFRSPARALVLSLACALAPGTIDGASAQASSPGPALTDATVVELPTRYDAGRFYVSPVTAAGDTVELYTDTGGGPNILFPDAVDRLDLETRRVAFRDDSLRIAALPVWEPDAAVPSPAVVPPHGPWPLVRSPRPYLEGDGFLGRTWFAGRVWLFDYPGGSLGRVLAWDAEAHPRAHRVRLGFQTDSAGRRTTHFPRIRVAVEGDSLDLLFDTGATVTLGGEALRVLGDDGPADRGASFIVRSVYEEWRREHPDWRVFENGDAAHEMPMIEVPRLSVAGHTVGPVRFTVRPDRSFHGMMSQWMDRRVDGALGGSALRYFRVIVDYPSATALFLRPGGPEGSDRRAARRAGRPEGATR